MAKHKTKEYVKEMMKKKAAAKKKKAAAKKKKGSSGFRNASKQMDQLDKEGY